MILRILLFVSGGVGLLAAVADAYDVGCAYPERMPDPFVTQRTLALLVSSFATNERALETPIAVREGHLSSYCNSNCAAYHDAHALDVLTKTSPIFRTPPAYHNSWSRALCLTQCWSMQNGGPALRPALAAWEFPVLPLSDDLVGCDGDPACIRRIVADSDWEPRLIGQVVALEISRITARDGWNANGALVWDWETERAVPCSANCAPYADTTGYYPVNHPGPPGGGKNKKGKSKGKRGRKGGGGGNKEDAKYRVTGTDKHWQPILEHDGEGYFSRQEFVVPHIGYTVQPNLIRNWRRAPKPRYDYRREANLVVERLRNLSSSRDMKARVPFFDNKLLVRGLFQYYVRLGFADTYKFEDHMLFIHAVSTAEYDALLQAWREKVRYDLVRPTTVIQRWGDDVLNTYGGDPAAALPANVSARDFQSFIRVMPHSEYPSASACLCTAYAELTDLFVRQQFNATSVGPMYVGRGQRSDGVPHFPFCQGFALCSPEQEFVMQDMTELKRSCGESRLWGGMHFTRSVSAAEEICEGIGARALDLFNELKASTTWGDPYTNGDARPTCPQGSE